MTRITANIILLTMTGVWAWLSISKNEIQAVSETFLYVGALVAGGEFAAISGVTEGLKKKFGVSQGTTINIEGLTQEGKKKDVEESS